MQERPRTLQRMTEVRVSDLLLVFRPVQPATATHASAWAALERCVPPGCLPLVGELWELRDAAAPPEDPPCAVALTTTEDSPATVTLHAFAVVPRLRSLGLGRRLVEELVDAARSAGAWRLVFRVDVAHARGIPLLARMGFRPIELHSIDDAGRSRLHMELDL